MIKIGVTAGLIYPDAERPYFAPKNLSFLVDDMANYLYQHNVLPILIPNLPHDRLQEFLSEMDGFVFQGGADVCPTVYGENYLDKKRWPGEEIRDRYELAIADYAFKHHTPMFGICRGMQLLNVFFGGTLHQDLQTECGVSHHQNREIYDKHFHDITFSPNGVLAKLYEECKQPVVNSIHHQGIKRLGRNLVIEAVSTPDKLIEAYSYTDMQQNFVLGVQWHPEYSHQLQETVIPGNLLYSLFLAAVQAKKETSCPPYWKAS